MAITTFSGLLAGLQPPLYSIRTNAAAISTSPGCWLSHWGYNGIPVAGSYSSSLNGVALVSNSGGSSYANNLAGQIPWLDPTSGNAYLARFQASPYRLGGPQPVLLLDRLWHNGGIDITGASSPQSITSPTWPARDCLGGTDGHGVMLGVEVSSLTGAGTPTITCSYTNSLGTSGRTAQNIPATVAGQNLGTFLAMSLQGGDIGVQSVQSVSLSSSWTSGTINLVAFRLVGCIGGYNSAVKPDAQDAIRGAMPQLFNGSVLFSCNGGFITALSIGGTNIGGVEAQIQFAWG